MSDGEIPTPPRKDYILRGGTLVKDPRLDRLQDFDPRNRLFPVMAMVSRAEAARPRSYTWKCLTWLDQGTEGACVGAAWGHELACRPAAVKGVTMDWARERVYWEAQRQDEWPGGSYEGADPVYEGTSVLAGAKVVQSLGWMAEYRWAFSVPELVLAIGYAGPAVLGVSWWSDMFEPDAEGFVHPTGYVAGGHAILCRAVNVRTQVFTLRNSWGASWGRDGDCKVTFEDMDTILRAGGEACIPVGRQRGSVS